MSSTDPTNPEDEQKFAASGGIWADDNLLQSLDWQGETTGGQAAIDSGKTYVPKTADQINTEILEKNNISPDIIGAITAKVERKIVGGKNSSNSSIIEMVETALRNESDKVQRWLDSQSKRLDSIAESAEAQKNVKQSDIDRLDEKMRILEERISAMITESTANKTDEFAIVTDAAKIIRDRRANEELETESTPSILERMETRADQLNAQLRGLEPHVEVAHRQTIAKAAKPAAVRRKFGRTM